MAECYKEGGSCGPYEHYSCSECPASKPSYKIRYINPEEIELSYKQLANALREVYNKQHPEEVNNPNYNANYMEELMYLLHHSEDTVKFPKLI